MKNNIISRLLTIACFSFVFLEVKAQSCITNINYASDRVGYLSQLNQSKIGSDYLIDRVVYDNNLLSSNGQAETLVNTPSDFFKNTESVLFSNQDTLIRKNYVRFIENHVAYHNGTDEYPIGIANYKYKRIKCNALTDGSFTQAETGLIENNTSTTSYEENRYFSVSPLTGIITGNNVKFYLGNMFNLSNLTNEKIEKIEIDFGNSSGYQIVLQNQSTSVNYGSSSSFILIKAKVTVKNLSNSTTQILYSSSTVYRQAVSTIAQKRVNPNARVSIDNITQPDIYQGFPDNSFHYVTKNVYCQNQPQTGYPSCFEQIKVMDYKINYSIIFSDQNQTSRKLRKPLIFCDGFDPGNNRSYYSTYHSKSPDLEKDKDFRGLFHLINGDPSPWYNGSSSVGLVDKLLAIGYDIVVIDYIDGAGDVEVNASYVRRFLNEVINSPTYRDNQTEEAIFVGPSMGGLISRIAIKTMENASENHHIKQWVSFDSPQQGAYIPISLQLGMEFFTKTNGTMFNEDAKAAVNALNATAALQMLTYHHTNSKSGYGAPNGLFNQFYQNINNLGYPNFTQNISITNGGLDALYNSNDSYRIILGLKVTNWTYIYGKRSSIINTDADWTFKGSRQGFKNDEQYSLKNYINFEPAPGGWHSALYSANYNSNNYEKDNIPGDKTTQFQKACFIPSISALGIKPTESNVAITWNQVVARGGTGLYVSPFDDIYGMQTNEEHVRISESTGQYLQTKLLNYNKSVQKPYSNDRFNITQNVSSPVKYKAYEYFNFCGINNNKFVLKNGADVVVESGIAVIFNPGFSTETGAKLDVKINSSLAVSQSNARKESLSLVPEYLSISPYSTQNSTNLNTNLSNNPTPYPNPISDGYLNFGKVAVSYILYNAQGQQVAGGAKVDGIAVDNLETGLYLLKIDGEVHKILVQ